MNLDRRPNLIPRELNLLDVSNVSPVAVEYRRRLMAKSLISGVPAQVAGEMAGFSKRFAVRAANNTLRNESVQDSFRQILARAGLTDEYLARKGAELAEAQTTVFAQKDGTFTDSRTLPALETQRKTWETLNKMAGNLKDKSEIDIRLGVVAQIVDVLNNPSK